MIGAWLACCAAAAPGGAGAVTAGLARRPAPLAAGRRRGRRRRWRRRLAAGSVPPLRQLGKCRETCRRASQTPHPLFSFPFIPGPDPRSGRRTATRLAHLPGLRPRLRVVTLASLTARRSRAVRLCFRPRRPPQPAPAAHPTARPRGSVFACSSSAYRWRRRRCWPTATQSATAAAAAMAGLSIMSHLRNGDPVAAAGAGVVRTMIASIAWQRAQLAACASAVALGPSRSPSDQAASVSASRQSSAARRAPASVGATAPRICRGLAESFLSASSPPT